MICVLLLESARSAEFRESMGERTFGTAKQNRVNQTLR